MTAFARWLGAKWVERSAGGDGATMRSLWMQLDLI